MSKVVIPNTQQEAVQILDKRRKHHMERTMYDMLLTGLAYCNEEEFNSFTFSKDTYNLIPCLWCNKIKKINKPPYYKCNAVKTACLYIDSLDNVRFKEYHK